MTKRPRDTPSGDAANGIKRDTFLALLGATATDAVHLCDSLKEPFRYPDRSLAQ